MVDPHREELPVVRPRARALVTILVSILALAGSSGCRHRLTATPDLGPPPLAGEGIQGEKALVVPVDEESGALARTLARHLGILPLRIHEPADLSDSTPVSGGEAAAVWQERAWSARIPYVLLVDASSPEPLVGEGDTGTTGEEPPARPAVRLLPARSGGEILSWSVPAERSPGAAVVALRSAIRDDFALPDERPDGHPTRWMVCPSEELETLRVALLLDAGPGVLARIREQVRRFPLDPALIELEGVALCLTGEEAEGRRALRRAQAFHPQGGSELPRLARMAGRAGLDELRLRILGWAVETWPGRVDYALTLAGALDTRDRHREGAELLLDAASRLSPLDPDAVELPADPVEHAAALGALARRADLRYSLGWLLHQTDRRDPALQAYAMARQLYRIVDEPVNEATCANNSGVILIEAGRPLAALPALRQALSARMVGGINREAANTLYNLGAAYQELGRYEDAADVLGRAAGGYREVGAEEDRFDTLLEIVIVRGEMSSGEGVEEAYAAALVDVAEGEDGLVRRAMALDAVGVARARIDRFDESLAALDEALATWIAVGDRLHEGQTRYNMAIPHLGRGDLDEALAALREARSIALELGDAESVIEIDRQMDQIEQMQ